MTQALTSSTCEESAAIYTFYLTRVLMYNLSNDTVSQVKVKDLVLNINILQIRAQLRTRKDSACEHLKRRYKASKLRY